MPTIEVSLMNDNASNKKLMHMFKELDIFDEYVKPVLKPPTPDDDKSEDGIIKTERASNGYCSPLPVKRA